MTAYLAKVMPEDVVFESGVHHPSLTKKTRKIKKNSTADTTSPSKARRIIHEVRVPEKEKAKTSIITTEEQQLLDFHLKIYHEFKDTPIGEASLNEIRELQKRVMTNTKENLGSYITPNSVERNDRWNQLLSDSIL